MISEITQYLWKTLDQDEKVALAPRPENLVSLRSRRATLQRFRNHWDGQGDWKKAYLKWLPTDEAGQHTRQDKPLIGTQVASAIHKTGLDKLAALYVKKTGKPCGCNKREEQINDLHRKVKEKLKRV